MLMNNKYPYKVLKIIITEINYWERVIVDKYMHLIEALL